MRTAATTILWTAACVLSLAAPLSWPVAADDSAAHALADKFSHAAEQAERAQAAQIAAKKAEAQRARIAADKAERRKAEAERAAYEADMLRRAQAEAAARREADQRAFEEQARREAEQEKARVEAEQQEKARLEAEQEKARAEAEQEKARLAAEQEKARAEAARLAREAEESRQEEERRAEEARKAEAARLAREVEEKRRAEEQAKAEEARRAEAARLAKEAEEKAEAKRVAEEQRAADEARAKLEEMRIEEARRIAEKFRLAREARERERAGTRNSLGGPPPPPEVDEPAPWSVETESTHTVAPTSRVTVLLLVEPRRRHGFSAARRTANPVLCLRGGCYISSGPAAPAEFMSRWKALGPANSVGRRAGPCRDQLACVFRNVDLGGETVAMQPVDMGFWRHDRREFKTVRADRSCDLIAGRLFCASPVVARNYRAWIVPEALAAKASVDALLDVLEQGLPSARAAHHEDDDDWLADVHALPTR